MILNLKVTWKAMARNVFFILLIFVSTLSEAASGDIEITFYMESLKDLPLYCQYRLAETEFRERVPVINGKRKWPLSFGKSRSKWEKIIGSQNWTYIHHYCFGIKKVMDYSRMTLNKNRHFTKDQLQNQLESALAEFEFMRNANTLNFPFFYDLYRYESLIYSNLGSFEKSMWALKQAYKYKRK